MDGEGVGAAITNQARRAARLATVDHPVAGEDTRQPHLHHRLDDPGTANAGDALPRQCVAESRLVGPEIRADHANPGLQGDRVDPYPFYGAGRSTLAGADLGAFKGRSGRTGAGQQPLVVAEHDFRIGTDVHQQADRPAPVGLLAKHHPSGIGADMTGDTGQQIGYGAWIDLKAKVSGRQVDRLLHRQREGRPAQLHRADAEQQMMHDRVAHERQAKDVLRVDGAVRYGSGHELVDGSAHLPGQFIAALRVHHDIGDPAHQVLAKADLRIHHAVRTEHVTTAEVA